jgi:hypothetical protein
MTNRGRGLNLALAAAIAWSTAVMVQTAGAQGSGQATAKGATPDLTGVWGSPAWDSDPDSLPSETNPVNQEPIPYQQWAEEKYIYAKDPFNERVRVELDPMNRCFPPSPFQVMGNLDPFEIFQVPGRVLIYSEYNRELRQVWMNEEHPEYVDPTWLGHSVGRWDGNTLVVDTVAIDDRNSWGGFVHTDALHLIERIRKTDPQTLEVEMTIDDPKAYTRPWRRVIVRHARSDWKISPSILCDERYKMGIYGDTY